MPCSPPLLLFLSSMLLAPLALTPTTAAAAASAPRGRCKCIPGDACWPTTQAWTAFNTSLAGKLVPARPLAAACHVPAYDAAACAAVQARWTDPSLHDSSPSSIMAAAVANASCDPFTSRELPCEPGASVTYAVNASDAADVVKAIAFARDNNIRLVVRNTGHDYLGKSTGQWALSVWTHHMKRTEYLPFYNDTAYRGPAMRLGAGVQVEEAYIAARAHNALVVGGDCATVGVAGGYLQGGGHSPLSSLHGLAADSVLAWEVVDGTGTRRTASRAAHRDLYWALSGGGGGTYGIAVSATVKLHADVAVTGVQLNFTLDAAKPAAFHRGVRAYHALMASTATAAPYHGMGIAAVTNASFALTPLTLPNVTRGAATALLAPLLAALDADGTPYALTVAHFATWLAFYQALIKPNPTQRVQNAQYGGWMVPRRVVDHRGGRELQAAIQRITDAGCAFVSLALNASAPAGEGGNAVHPAWRDAALSVLLSTPWPQGARREDMKVLAHTMTNTCVPALSKLAPEAGAYMSEADPDQADWKKAFYGPNYNRLLDIKNRYDPDHLFYAHTAVGSDFYAMDAEGRLCEAS